MPANSADPRIARNGGTLRTVNTTSSASGSRFTTEMWKAFSSASSALSGSTAASGSTPRPITRKITRLTPSAGAAVQNMLRMCSPVVTPPTICGTRIVVSDSGVILSPKYAPQMIAPAAISFETPITPAMPTNATPSVPAVVHELPVTVPTMAQMTAVARKKMLGLSRLTP